MKKVGWTLGLALLILNPGFTNPSMAQNLSLEFMTGSAYNLPSFLIVRQANQPDLTFSPHYDTNPFSGHAPYYAWRVSLWNGEESWEFEHLHHKLYLRDNPPEITDFAISHGYNYILLGHAWKRHGFLFHLDLGPIMTHPEAAVRGQTLDSEHGGLLNEGYYFSGIGFHTAIGKNIFISDNFYAILELAFTAGWTWDVPMPGGTADVPNTAIHGHLGMGLNL